MKSLGEEKGAAALGMPPAVAIETPDSLAKEERAKEKAEAVARKAAAAAAAAEAKAAAAAAAAEAKAAAAAALAVEAKTAAAAVAAEPEAGSGAAKDDAAASGGEAGAAPPTLDISAAATTSAGASAASSTPSGSGKRCVGARARVAHTARLPPPRMRVITPVSRSLLLPNLPKQLSQLVVAWARARAAVGRRRRRAVA